MTRKFRHISDVDGFTLDFSETESIEILTLCDKNITIHKEAFRCAYFNTSIAIDALIFNNWKDYELCYECVNTSKFQIELFKSIRL